MDILVVTAVEAEAAAIAAALPAGAPIRLLVGGVGPAAAAVSTAVALAVDEPDLVLSAGIAGGFGMLAPGDVAVATACVFADLGVETSDGFVAVSALGFGTDRYEVAPKLAVQLADRTGGHLGAVLTVATVTGTEQTALALSGRHPDAVAEAMEGAGVAAAAVHRGIAFGEIRTISNAVGPRDRDAWRVPEALDALGAAIAAIVAGETSPPATAGAQSTS